MLQSETDLDDQLEALAKALDKQAPPPDGPTIQAQPVPLSAPSRRRRHYVLALAAAAVIVIVGALVVGQIGRTDIATGPASQEDAEEPPAPTTTQPSTTETPTTTEPPPAAEQEPTVGPYLTDGAPAELALESTRSAADLGEPVSELITHIYGLADKPEPEEGDPRLTVSIAKSLGAPLEGTPIDVRGGDGVVRADGAIGFADGETVVWLTSRTLDQATLVDVANQLVVNPDGVEPLAEGPAGLGFLGEVVSHLYDDFGSSVPADGHSADYTNGDRTLSVMSGPAGPNAQAVLNWSTDAVPTEVGDRTVVIVESDPSFTQALWLEGDALVRVVAIGLTPDEISAAIEGVRPAGDDW